MIDARLLIQTSSDSIMLPQNEQIILLFQIWKKNLMEFRYKIGKTHFRFVVWDK